MKTIICEKPYQFKMVETALTLRKPGEVMIQIKKIGICGTDLHAFQGNQPFFSYPRILGHELSGIVQEVDERAENNNEFFVGDEVAIIPYLHCGECIACRNKKTNCCNQLKVLGVHIDGGMREFVSVPATHLIKTKGIPLEHAALIEPLCIGAHALRRANLQQGETILVIGAGPIGLGVMAFAQEAGMRVIAMDINKERLDFCKQWAGIDATVNALYEPMKALNELTHGDLATAVFDATGNARSMNSAFEYTSFGGKLIYVGLHKGDVIFTDSEFHKKEITLMASRNANREDFDYVIERLKANVVDMNAYITHKVDFDDMIDHFDNWLKPESKVIKAIVSLDAF